MSKLNVKYDDVSGKYNIPTPTPSRSDAEPTREDIIFRPDRVGNDDLKRYTLVIPQAVFDEVQRLADANQTTVVDLFRRFTRLGLLAMYLQEKPDAALVIRDGDTEQRLLFW